MTGQSILTLLAHPDDAELWAGGVLARHVQTGAGPVTIALAHHDTVRDAEAAAGADILGARLLTLDRLTVDHVTQVLRDVQPDVVISHQLDDIHDDHRRAVKTLLAALPPAVIATGHPSRVYSCDSYNSLTLYGPVRAGTIVDVTAYWDIKMFALSQHKSQPITDHFGPMAETLGRLWGARIGTCYAEAFEPLPVLGRIPKTEQL